MGPQMNTGMVAPGIMTTSPIAETSMMMISLLITCALLVVVVPLSLKQTMIHQEMIAAGMRAVYLTVVITTTKISKQREIAYNANQQLITNAQLAGMLNTMLVTQVVTAVIGTSDLIHSAALTMTKTSQLHNSAVHARTAHLITQLTSVISQEYPKLSSAHFSYKV